MTIQECYQQLGGDYAALKTRLPSDSLIKRFITRFLDDSSYAELCDALQKGRRAEAFRAAHTLKGVCANLAFDQLGTSVSVLTELLRPEGASVPDDALFIWNEVKLDYESTVKAIRACLASEHCPE